MIVLCSSSKEDTPRTVVFGGACLADILQCFPEGGCENKSRRNRAQEAGRISHRKSPHHICAALHFGSKECQNRGQLQNGQEGQGHVLHGVDIYRNGSAASLIPAIVISMNIQNLGPAFCKFATLNPEIRF